MIYIFSITKLIDTYVDQIIYFSMTPQCRILYEQYINNNNNNISISTKTEWGNLIEISLLMEDQSQKLHNSFLSFNFFFSLVDRYYHSA